MLLTLLLPLYIFLFKTRRVFSRFLCKRWASCDVVHSIAGDAGHLSFLLSFRTLHNLRLPEEQFACSNSLGLFFDKCVHCCSFSVLEQRPELAHHHPLLLVLQRRGR